MNHGDGSSFTNICKPVCLGYSFDQTLTTSNWQEHLDAAAGLEGPTDVAPCPSQTKDLFPESKGF